jgi:hypothetical protein
MTKFCPQVTFTKKSCQLDYHKNGSMKKKVHLANQVLLLKNYLKQASEFTPGRLAF